MWGRKAQANPGSLAGSLHDEKLKSSIILNAIEDGVILIDTQGTLRVFNPGATRITGWVAEEAEGLDWRLVFKFTDAKGQAVADNDTIIAKALAAGQPVRDNIANLLSKNGKSVALSFSASPLVDTAKKVTGVVGIFRDVSVERQEESQRADFISTASHEMRTPVAAIEGYLSLALNEKVANIDAKARDYLEKAHSSTQHLGQLFQDLLTSAKAEDGRLTNHPRVVEIGAFAEQLVSDLKFSAEKKGLFLESNLANMTSGTDGSKVIRPLFYAQADPDRMREVITNLFDNAVKYTDTGRITIGLTGNDQVVQFSIKDTGNGIPAEDIPHLFQKFYRVDNSNTRTIGGTGLGLFICRKIVELYQGRIWVESEVGKGSTFFINLPRLTTQKAEAMMATEATNPEGLQPAAENKL
jgi:PAS domain S-box-containing protein